MHTATLLGGFLTFFSILRACQALSVGYVLDAKNLTGECKDVAQFQANFQAISKNIPISINETDIVVRVSSSDCRVLSTAVNALQSSRISNIRLWLDFDIPTKQDSGDPRNVTVDWLLLRLVVDEIRYATKYSIACDFLAGVSLEHYGELNSQDTAEALARLSISAPIGFNPYKPEACRAVKIGFKSSANAWLSKYTGLARYVEHVAFPYGVSSDETDVHAVASSLLDTVDELEKTFPKLPIVVASTGWPSSSITNEQLYWQQFWCAKGDVASKDTINAVFWDSVIDGANTNGLLDKDGKAKFHLDNCTAI